MHHILRKCLTPFLRLAPFVGFGGVALTSSLILMEKAPPVAVFGAIGLLILSFIWWLIRQGLYIARFCRITLSKP